MRLEVRMEVSRVFFMTDLLLKGQCS
jgi:hypothetical protein